MSTHRIPVAGVGTVEVSFTERGDGHPLLLLHGGGGPQTVSGFAELMAAQRAARVITPPIPGSAAPRDPTRWRAWGILRRCTWRC